MAECVGTVPDTIGRNEVSFVSMSGGGTEPLKSCIVIKNAQGELQRNPAVIMKGW